jgi:DNA polymerase-3 subunit delta'
VSDHDSVEGVPHPRATFALFGHGAAERMLLDAYRSGRMPHAWLIGGPAGIGKATLAYRAARFILAHPDPQTAAVQHATSLALDPDHHVSRRIAGQAHPDVLAIERTVGETGRLNRFIKVEDVRRCVTFFGSTAGEGGWRIAIVDAVDETNEAGENALLKILEEPPARAMLFLISHTPARIRTTIRSRCRRLLLRPLAAHDVAAAVAAAIGRHASDEDIRRAADAAEGRVAAALALLDGDALELRDRILELLGRLPALDAYAVHAIGDSLGGTADPRDFSALVNTLSDWLAAQLHDNTADKRRALRLAEAWESVNRIATEAEAYNLERKPVIFRLFGLLAEAARA